MFTVLEIQATPKWQEELLPIPIPHVKPVRRPRTNKTVSVRMDVARYLIDSGYAKKVGIPALSPESTVPEKITATTVTPVSKTVVAKPIDTIDGENKIHRTAPVTTGVAITKDDSVLMSDESGESQINPELTKETAAILQFFRQHNASAIADIPSIGLSSGKSLKEKGDSLTWQDVSEILSDRQIENAQKHILGVVSNAEETGKS